jgi:hypothetical protein
MARDMRGSGGSSVANLDSRNPQIGSFFCPLCEEAGRAGKTGCALGSHCGATTNDQFRGFFGTCETVSPELSNPRVAGSSPAGRIFFDDIRITLDPRSSSRHRSRQETCFPFRNHMGGMVRVAAHAPGDGVADERSHGWRSEVSIEPVKAWKAAASVRRRGMGSPEQRRCIATG